MNAVGGSAFTNVALAKTLAVPPALQRVTVNDGSAQRSRVTSLTVSFSQPVTLAGGAITLAADNASVGVVPTYAWSSTDGGLNYVVTFNGTSVIGGSIADGRYSLTVHAGLVQNAAGAAMESDQTVAFHRFFGDIDGDAGVSIADFNPFASSFGTNSSSTGFNAAFDWDADGVISIGDFNPFATRFGVTI